MEIKGRIFSGWGQGAFFTQLDWTKKQCDEKLKFVPFPGTLNLKVEGEYLDAVRKLKERDGIILDPPSTEFCQAKCFSISISSFKAAIVVPHAEDFTNEIHSENVIEIIAPINIKEALSVKDGDELILELEEK